MIIKDLLKRKILSVAIVLALSSAGKSTAQTYAQSLQSRFETALIDSAMKFESTKARLAELQTAFKFLQIEQNEALKMQAVLIDSAIRYESVKVRLASLQKAFNFQADQIGSMQKTADFLSFQIEQQKKNFDFMIADQRKKYRKNILIGILAAAAAGVLLSN